MTVELQELKVRVEPNGVVQIFFHHGDDPLDTRTCNNYGNDKPQTIIYGSQGDPFPEGTDTIIIDLV